MVSATARKRLNKQEIEELARTILKAVAGGATKMSKLLAVDELANYTPTQVEYTTKNLIAAKRLVFRKKRYSLPNPPKPKLELVHPKTHEVVEAPDENGVRVVVDARPLGRKIVAALSPSDPRVVNKFLLLIVRVGSVEEAQQALDAAAELLKRVRS